MTTQTSEPSVNTSLTQPGAGRLSDRAFWLVTLIAGLLVLAVLALILVTTLNESLPALRYSGLEFFTSPSWVPNDPDGDGPLGPQFGASGVHLRHARSWL